MRELTVADLIAALSKMPQDAVVFSPVGDFDGGIVYDSFTKVEVEMRCEYGYERCPNDEDKVAFVILT